MGRRNRFLATDELETPELSAEVRDLARPLRDERDLGSLLDRIGGARYVLLGEASHGTSEFYTWRAAITRRLVAEKGFSFLAVEGDWPDCYRLNRFLKGETDEDAREALSGFERWPTWMWANEEILALAGWLREFNDGRPAGRKVGFYGLDVYSLWDSLYQITAHVRKTNPDLLPAARKALRCFQPYGEDVQEYAHATRWADDSCENEVVALLAEVRHAVGNLPGGGAEEHFNAEQNALVVQNAERYYRTMVRGGAESWNVRDRHMTETLDRLMAHHGPAAKCVVWEHNTHVGDARYTDMLGDGMVNVGQLVREGHERDGVVLVGFGTNRGAVLAGREWDAPVERMPVPVGRPGSWEDVMHRATRGQDALFVFGDRERAGPMALPRGHRAIGVVYHPEYEHLGNYVPTVLPRRYDAFLFVEQTEALHALPVRQREADEVPETFPSGV